MPYFENKGASIHYDVQGKGVPLLLMHGFTESALDLEDLAVALSQEYWVIAPDLRGYGRSQPKPRLYTPDFYREDADEMAALLAHLGVRQAHVMGFSDGGEVALLMAILYPQLIKSAIEWGAAGTLGEGGILPELDAIYNLIDSPTDELQGWSRYVNRQYGESVARKMVQGWASASKTILGRGGDISLARAGEIACPALLISGEHDPYATPSMTRELASRIPQSDYFILEGVGHAVHEERPQWFTRTVLDWLKRQTSDE